MTLIATWYPTEEQRLEFEQTWARVYNNAACGRVFKVEMHEYRWPHEGEYYAEVYWADSPFTSCRELILASLIKDGYFVL